MAGKLYGKNEPGVLLELRKSELIFDLVSLLRDGVIEVEDLEGFSDELKEAIAWGKDQQKNIKKVVEKKNEEKYVFDK